MHINSIVDIVNAAHRCGIAYFGYDNVKKSPQGGLRYDLWFDSYEDMHLFKICNANLRWPTSWWDYELICKVKGEQWDHIM